MKSGRVVSMLAAAVVFAAAGCASAPRGEPAGYAEDAMITARVKTAILNDPQLDAAEVKGINVETYQGVVQLSGFIGSRDAELRATELARSVAGVKAVNNDLRLNMHLEESTRQ